MLSRVRLFSRPASSTALTRSAPLSASLVFFFVGMSPLLSGRPAPGVRAVGCGPTKKVGACPTWMPPGRSPGASAPSSRRAVGAPPLVEHVGRLERHRDRLPSAGPTSDRAFGCCHRLVFAVHDNTLLLRVGVAGTRATGTDLVSD